MSQGGNIIVGLDVGTASTRTIVAQNFPEEEVPRIIGVGIKPSAGMRKGAVVDIEEVTKSINDSLSAAETMSGIEIKEVVVGIGGTDISSQNSKGVVAVGKADGEVTFDDVQRVASASQAISVPLNKEILHVVPRRYILDNQKDIKDPLGMHGVRLELDSMIIESPASHLKNVNKCLQTVGIGAGDSVLEILAASQAVLNKKQKELGVVLVDIGAGTTSVAVFEEGDLLHVAVLPVGAGHITNDIAIGLRSSVDIAEKVKLEYGVAISDGVNKKEDIDLALIDPEEEGLVSRYHVVEIIEARLEEILKLVNEELTKIGKAGLLPAGAVLTGGGVKMPRLIEAVKDSLGLPAQVGFPARMGGLLDKVDDPAFSSAVGLILWNQNRNNPTSGTNSSGISSGVSEGMKNIFSQVKGNDTARKVHHWVKKFLP